MAHSFINIMPFLSVIEQYHVVIARESYDPTRYVTKKSYTSTERSPGYEAAHEATSHSNPADVAASLSTYHCVHIWLLEIKLFNN